MEKIRKWEKQRRLYKVPRLRRLPWLRCRHCLWPLAQVDMRDGLTCLRFGRIYKFDHCIVCPRCGMVRKFVSIVI